MSLEHALIRACDQAAEIAKRDHSTLPTDCNVSEHDNDPDALMVILELSTGDLIGVAFTDSQPYSPERKDEIEAAFIFASAMACGLGIAFSRVEI